MKFICITLLFGTIALANARYTYRSNENLKKPYYDLKLARYYFDKFVKDYNRRYKDASDEEVHYRAFVKSLAIINEANAQSKSAVFDIGKFADYTEKEQKHLFGLKLPKTKDSSLLVFA